MGLKHLYDPWSEYTFEVLSKMICPEQWLLFYVEKEKTQ